MVLEGAVRKLWMTWLVILGFGIASIAFTLYESTVAQDMAGIGWVMAAGGIAFALFLSSLVAYGVYGLEPFSRTISLVVGVLLAGGTIIYAVVLLVQIPWVIAHPDSLFFWLLQAVPCVILALLGTRMAILARSEEVKRAYNAKVKSQ